MSWHAEQPGQAEPQATPRRAVGAWYPRLIILCGVAYTTFFIAQLRDEVFYSGDGGLKALLVQQLSRGEFTDALKLPAEPWVRLLWGEGFYPFGPPFVYDLPRGKVLAFPPWFAVLSTPFYMLLGVRGLYVIPALSLWLLWLRMAATARRLGLSCQDTTILLVLIVMSTPLTLYGAMFWEHTLGVLLAWFGVEFLVRSAHDSSGGVSGSPAQPEITPGRTPPAAVRPGSSAEVSSPAALTFGLLAGLAAWVRSEVLCLLVAFILLAGLQALHHAGRRARWFALGLAVGVGALFSINLHLYGRILGVHGAQVVGEAVVSVGEQGYGDLLRDLVLYMPVVLFVAVAGLCGSFKACYPEARSVRVLLFIAVIYFLAVPWIVPNLGGKQWGPRYLLVLAPILCLLAGTLPLPRRVEQGRLRRKLTQWVFLGCTAAGIFVNMIVGTRTLSADYAGRVRPALEFLRTRSEKCVAVSEQWIAQELAAAFDRRAFFWVRGPGELRRLADGLFENGQTRLLFISEPDQRFPERLLFDHVGGPTTGIGFRPCGRYGDYAVYEAELLTRDGG